MLLLIICFLVFFIAELIIPQSDILIYFHVLGLSFTFDRPYWEFTTTEPRVIAIGTRFFFAEGTTTLSLYLSWKGRLQNSWLTLAFMTRRKWCHRLWSIPCFLHVIGNLKRGRTWLMDDFVLGVAVSGPYQGKIKISPYPLTSLFSGLLQLAFIFIGIFWCRHNSKQNVIIRFRFRYIMTRELSMFTQ